MDIIANGTQVLITRGVNKGLVGTVYEYNVPTGRYIVNMPAGADRNSALLSPKVLKVV